MDDFCIGYCPICCVHGSKCSDLSLLTQLLYLLLRIARRNTGWALEDNLFGKITPYRGQIETGTENEPYQVQKCPPPHGSIFRARSQAISLANSNERWRRMRVWYRLRPHVQKTIADRFPIPFSGSVSPNGAIFPYLLFSNAHPSFGAILGKRYCWGPALRQNFCTWQMALDLSPSGSSKNIAMWHPNVPTKNHLNCISARSSEDPILLGKMGLPIYLGKHKEPAILLGRSPPGAHHFTWKNTRSPPGAHHFTWKNTRNPPGAHHFTWKNTRSPPGAHHFTWKKTRSPTFHPLGNIIIIEKWQRSLKIQMVKLWRFPTWNWPFLVLIELVIWKHS